MVGEAILGIFWVLSALSGLTFLWLTATKNTKGAHLYFGIAGLAFIIRSGYRGNELPPTTSVIFTIVATLIIICSVVLALRTTARSSRT
jgi:hypothetical protein